MCSQDKAKGITETQTCHLASSYQLLILALDQLCLDWPDSIVLPHSACGKKNYASAHTKQEREQQERKTKLVLLDVQCREEKKKEIPNKEQGESAGGKVSSNYHWKSKFCQKGSATAAALLLILFLKGLKEPAKDAAEDSL